MRLAGDRILIAGHLPVGDDGKIAGPFGKVGAEVTVEDAVQSARQVALTMIASLQATGVDLDRVAWRKAFGMVNAAPGFQALPNIVNGFSELVLEVFGERGRHSRSAVGVAELPFGVPVEVEAEVALLGAANDSTPAGAPRTLRAPPNDPGLRRVDYAGIHPLTLPAEALVRAIRALSNLFWFSIAGTVLAVFFAALVSMGDLASSSLAFGDYRIPLSLLPIACLAFATFMFWLIAARLRMLEGALADDDLTANLARDIFRLDPPVLDVFDADNLRRFALLSGVSMLLWNWSLFFGTGMGLIFYATLIRGTVESVDAMPAFLAYAAVTVAIMTYGAVRILPLLRRILAKLHGRPLKIGVARSAVAALLMLVAFAAFSPQVRQTLLSERYEWEPLEPSSANAVNGETLLLEKGEIVVLAGIEALRPGQFCGAADGTPYPCGQQATAHLQSLVHDQLVTCFVTYGALGICMPLNAGEAPPRRLERITTERSLAAQMVAAGLAFAEGDGTDWLLSLQDEAQRQRLGAWQGSFEPPEQWQRRQGAPGS